MPGKTPAFQSSQYRSVLLKNRSDWQQAPPPQSNKERVAALAWERQSGNTLFITLFWGEEGKRI